MFSLIQHHKYSISDLEALMPYERDIYVDLLTAHLEAENERRKQQQR